MKYLALLLLLIPLSLFGQVESQFNGTLNIFSGYRIGSTNTFTISGIFSSTTSQYTSTQVDTGDVIQVLSGANFYWFHVYSIASSSGGVITCNVRDSTSTRTVAPSGIVNLFRPTPNLRLPLQADGISNAAKSSVFNTLALRVDNIQTSVANSTNCEQTLTKNSHGFRKWTPIYWTGATYARPTYDTIVPDYIVVDSLTANTFTVANCGTYETTLTDGLYWFTSASPGYSLTQDTVKVPLFQVIDSVLFFQPLVGFNLMASSASGDVTSAVLADTAAAIRAADTNFGNSDLTVPPSTDRYLYYDENANSYQYISSSPSYLENGVYLTPDNDVYGYNGIWHGRTSSVNRNLYGQLSGYLTSGGSGLDFKNTYSATYGANMYHSASISSSLYAASVNDWKKASVITIADSVAVAYGALLSVTGASTYPNKMHYVGILKGVTSSAHSQTVGNYVANDRYFINNSLVNYHIQTNNTGGGNFPYNWLSVTDLDDSTANRAAISLYNASYTLPNYVPVVTSGATSNMLWTGSGSATTPTFQRFQNTVAAGTTDGSGDLTVTFAAAMPDATYTFLCTAEGTTYYTTTVHTKATGTVKIRFFDAAGAAVTGASVTISYEAKDY